MPEQESQKPWGQMTYVEQRLAVLEKAVRPMEERIAIGDSIALDHTFHMTQDQRRDMFNRFIRIQMNLENEQIALASFPDSLHDLPNITDQEANRLTALAYMPAYALAREEKDELDMAAFATLVFRRKKAA